MRPPRKLRRTPEDRSLQIGKRMSAGTAQGRVDSASPVRNTIPAKATQRRGGDCVNEEFTWFEPGVLGTWTGTDRWYPPFEVKVFSVHIASNTAPTGSSIKVDLNLNGTTIFTNQTHRPEIAVSTNEGSATLIDVPLMALGDYLTFDIDQVGSTIAGSDLAVTIGFTVCPSAINTPGLPPVSPCDDFLGSLPGTSIVFSTDWHTGDTSELTFGTGGLVGNATSDPTNFGSVTNLSCSTYEYTGANQIGPGFSGSFYVSDLAELYLRTEFYVTGAVAGGQFLSFGNNSTYGSWLVGLFLDGSGKLALTRNGGGGVTLATSGNALPLNAWHQFDVHLKLSTTAGICDISVDGASTYGFTFSGADALASDWLVQYIQLINPQTMQTYFFGRLAVSTP